MSRLDTRSIDLQGRAAAGSEADCYPRDATRLSSQVWSGCHYCRYSVAALSTDWLCWARGIGATCFVALDSATMGSLAGASLPEFYSNERLSSAVAPSSWLPHACLSRAAVEVNRSFCCSSPSPGN